MKISLQEIINLLQPIKYSTSLDRYLHGISMDSRTLKPDDLFVAIRGGHNFLEQAFKKDAIAAVIDNPDFFDPNVPLILVNDCIDALGKLASLWRKKHNCKIVAITGSAGKTTTTQMIAHLLAGKFKVHQTKANHNNQIGVPETIFGINEQTKIAVIEIGTNQFGEIETLTKMAAPNIGVITNIGHAHLEYFGSIEGVMKEKAALALGVLPDGTIVINGDNAHCRQILQMNQQQFADLKEDARLIIFGLSLDCNLQVQNISIGHGECSCELRFESEYQTINLNTEFYPNVFNAAAAIAVARKFKVSWETIHAQFKTFEMPKMRMQITKRNGVTLINDAYNANPDSVKAAVEALKYMDTFGKVFVVLGDMLELGEQSIKLHEEIGEFIKMSGVVDVFIGVGELMKHACAAALDKDTRVFHFEDKSLVTELLLALVNSKDLVLFKASRGMELETVYKEFCSMLNHHS